MAGRPRGQLLRVLRDRGPLTRTQAAEAIGLARSTLNAEIGALIEVGLVASGPTAPSSGGRRSVTVQLDPRVAFVAVSIGERRTRVALLDGGLAIGGRGVSLDPADTSAEELVDRVVDAARDLLGGASARPCAVGIALAEGPTSGARHLEDRLETVLDVPVVVERAAHAMALGERRIGAGRGSRHLVAVRLGAETTCGTVVDGHLARGSGGVAGAIGHYRVDDFGPACTCGGSGCLDSFASAAALVEEARVAAESGRSPVLAERLEQRGHLEVSDLVAAVATGDAFSVRLARDAARRLGGVIAALVSFANPEHVVLGGPLAALGPHLLSEVRSTVYRLAPTALAPGVSVELSALGERAVLVGAGVSASDRVFS